MDLSQKSEPVPEKGPLNEEEGDTLTPLPSLPPQPSCPPDQATPPQSSEPKTINPISSVVRHKTVHVMKFTGNLVNF